MKKFIAKLAIGLVLLGSFVMGTTVPASAHYTCTGSAGAMQGFPTPSAWISVICQANHYSTYISGWTLFRKGGTSTWSKAGPENHTTTFNTNSAGVQVRTTLFTCYTGDSERSYIAQYVVKNSSGTVVHTGGGIYGPIHTC